MRNVSHKTLIGTVRAAVTEWRKREGWSRETVVQQIVEAHDEIEGPSTTGIVFDPNTRDAFDRTKVNADRVFRWLDDEGKDTNLLPANFLPSILAALPLDLKLSCLGDILRPLGVEVTSSDKEEGAGFNAAGHLVTIIKESSEAQQALVQASQSQDADTLAMAYKEVQDMQEAATSTLRSLGAELAIKRARRGMAEKA